MIRKSFVVLGAVFSGCGLCCASSYTGLHTGCAHDDCHPMNGTGEALEQFMKMEEEVFSSLKCFDNHLKDLEKLDMKLAMQENYIRFIRAKLQGMIHGNLCGSYVSGGLPSLQNNLNSQTVVNNNTTMNTTNNTSINNNYSQNVQANNSQFVSDSFLVRDKAELYEQNESSRLKSAPAKPPFGSATPNLDRGALIQQFRIIMKHVKDTNKWRAFYEVAKALGIDQKAVSL